MLVSCIYFHITQPTKLDISDSVGLPIRWHNKNSRIVVLYILLTEPSSGHQWRVRYQIIKGICEGVRYLHQKSIIHVDLKPKNILFDDSLVPKIADFGISRRFSENKSRTITENLVGSR